MKTLTLGRGLSFAVFAGIGTFPWQLLWAPWLGAGSSLAAYMLFLCIVALAWLAPSLRSALLASGFAALLLVPVALVSPMPLTALIASLLVFGFARSGLSFGHAFARAFVAECVLGLTATALAALVYDARLFGTALAVWTFWLIQSSYALFQVHSEQPRRAPADAFSHAQSRADQLMRERPQRHSTLSRDSHSAR